MLLTFRKIALFCHLCNKDLWTPVVKWTIKPKYEFRSVPAWMAGKYHSSMQTGIVYPLVPPRNKFRDVLAVSGDFGQYRQKSWINSARMSFMWKKNWQIIKKKSYKPRWGEKIKGRRRRWEEKNQEEKKKNQEKLIVMRFIIYVCFLLESMEIMGFNNKWISLMMQCVSTVSYFVLINRVILGSIYNPN